MRITGGEHRGRALKVPPGARPSSARLRQALFSIWADRVHRACFLDLFAGSGSVGLEALSRGARRVLLVERRGRGLATLKENCGRLQESNWLIQAADLPTDLSRIPGPGSWDLVFADPPYRFTAHRALLDGIAPLLGESGRLAVEHSTRRHLPAGSSSLVSIDRREYGESSLTFYRQRPL